MARLSCLIASELPSEVAAAQQRNFVTFSCIPPSSQSFQPNEDPTITLLERPYLISGSRTTGFRTWEAALHLGTYFLTEEGSSLIRERNILELGAGTGFLSILCAKFLRARHVTSTDGDGDIVEALKENVFLNDLDGEEKIFTSVLRWGTGLKGTWLEDDCEAWPYDVILGTDIVRAAISNRKILLKCTNKRQIYDKGAISALIATLCYLHNLRPSVHVILSEAIRNIETFETFRQACSKLAHLHLIFVARD